MTTERHEGRRPYLKVFVALALLTAIEVGVAGMAIGQTARVLLLLGLAVAKASLVALFYMHLRYDHGILAIVGGFPLLLVIIMLIVFMADRSLGA
jgi:cytochrome c oxidase subunit 4